jgi:hypothetical protein
MTCSSTSRLPRMPRMLYVTGRIVQSGEISAAEVPEPGASPPLSSQACSSSSSGVIHLSPYHLAQLHPQLEICEGLEEASQVRNYSGRQLLLILAISPLQKLFKADLVDVWRRMVAHRRSELDLLPLLKDHLHVRVLAQVGQGGGLKVSS